MTEPPKKLRLFIAIDAPDPTRVVLAGLTTKSLAGVSWTPPHQIHLTLRFIGNTTEEQCQTIERAVAAVRVEPFLLPVEGVGAFPPRRPPRVLWAGTGVGHPRLFELRQQIDAALNAFGFPPEPRPFHPHFTLGRVSEKGRPAAIAEFLRDQASFVAPSFQVGNFILYKSDLGPHGAIHMPLSQIALAAR